MDDRRRAVVASGPSGCPGCGHPGRAVGRITLEALLRPAALARLTADAHRFCPTAACPLVYFRAGAGFARRDVRVPVFQKVPEGDRTVCYCFGISEAQIRSQARAAGVSAPAEQILVLVQAGRCACEARNPQGACCLGNVTAVAQTAVAAAIETA
jgi:Zinc binding domain